MTKDMYNGAITRVRTIDGETVVFYHYRLTSRIGNKSLSICFIMMNLLGIFKMKSLVCICWWYSISWWD